MGSNPAPRVIPQAEHSISASSISPHAVEVCERIREAGFDSYLVGGCVRDLMLGLHPKDFDVATDAHPEQVRELFRRARLIGRRFRLVHVRFGREIIEVATFRGDPRPDDLGRARAQQNGRSDENVYGTREQDARRRDFTVNALYYDIHDRAVIDDVGGVADIERRLLRIMGDAEARYRHDPVRMLRAVRFAAKLDLDIEPGTAAPIAELAPLLAEVPAARMFDEFLKLFHGGAALETYRLLRQHHLFAHLCPLAAKGHADDQDRDARDLFARALANTDARVTAGKPVIAAFLFAALLWKPMCRRLRKFTERRVQHAAAIRLAAVEVIEAQAQRVSIPRRVGLVIREIWEMQSSLERRDRKWIDQALEHRRFRAAYDFLLLRGEAGEVSPTLCEWWTRIQEMDEGERRGMIRSVPRGGVNRRRPRTRRHPQQSGA